MRVGIIGAGAAGLCSARRVLEAGMECVVFELAAELGGTWFYTDDVGTDEHGYPVYSAMYQGLRTNLPKEVMGFPDFPMPEQRRSYLSQAEVLEFLKNFTSHFELVPKIKFNRFVESVKPLPRDQWEIQSIDTPTGNVITDIFDAVMVCNGHYSDPKTPHLSGIEKFKGDQCHSHQYRNAVPYTGKRVLLIGVGPSGIDLSQQISKVAKKLSISHHSTKKLENVFPSNVDIKPDVARVIGDYMVEFKDGTKEEYDRIFYCTGYNYSFPFLDDSCKLTIQQKHLSPLYKHMIHIDYPTMCFMGIPFQICAFHMFDLQARFFVKFVNGEVKRTASEMREDQERDVNARLQQGYTMAQMHLMGPHQESYYNALATEGNTAPIPLVVVKLRNESVRRLYIDPYQFREEIYEVIDNDNYIKVQ